MSGRVHSRELKMTIVRQLASGEKRPARICREHNLAPTLCQEQAPVPLPAYYRAQAWRYGLIRSPKRVLDHCWEGLDG